MKFSSRFLDLVFPNPWLFACITASPFILFYFSYYHIRQSEALHESIIKNSFTCTQSSLVNHNTKFCSSDLFFSYPPKIEQITVNEKTTLFFIGDSHSKQLAFKSKVFPSTFFLESDYLTQGLKGRLKFDSRIISSIISSTSEYINDNGYHFVLSLARDEFYGSYFSSDERRILSESDKQRLSISLENILLLDQFLSSQRFYKSTILVKDIPKICNPIVFSSYNSVLSLNQCASTSAHSLSDRFYLDQMYLLAASSSKSISDFDPHFILCQNKICNNGSPSIYSDSSPHFNTYGRDFVFKIHESLLRHIVK